MGHYNNGFDGAEWIADVIPAASHRVVAFRLGEDILHQRRDFTVTGDSSEALQAALEEVVRRTGRLMLLAARIDAEIPVEHRSQSYAPMRIIEQMRSDMETSSVTGSDSDN